jgi:hypothetical protein
VFIWLSLLALSTSKGTHLKFVQYLDTPASVRKAVGHRGHAASQGMLVFVYHVHSTLTGVRGFHTSEFDTVTSVLGALSTLTWRLERAEWVCPCVCVARGRRPYSIRPVLSTEIVPREIKFSAVKVPPQPPLALLLTTTRQMYLRRAPKGPFARAHVVLGRPTATSCLAVPPSLYFRTNVCSNIRNGTASYPPHPSPPSPAAQRSLHKWNPDWTTQNKASDHPSTCLCCRPPSPCLRTHQHDVSTQVPRIHLSLSSAPPLRCAVVAGTFHCHVTRWATWTRHLFTHSFARTSHVLVNCLCLSDMHSCAPSDPQQVGWTRAPRLANKLERKAERGCVLHQEGQR